MDTVVGNLGFSSLPWFCRHWTGPYVILVWGEKPLHAIAESKFLKQPQEVVPLNNLIFKRHSSPYRVVVFDADDQLADAAQLQLFGGNVAVLVINVQGMAPYELMFLERKNRYVWGIDLPYWCPYVTTETQSMNVLFQASIRLRPDQYPLAIEELVTTVTKQTQHQCCYGCLISRPSTTHETCKHSFCKACLRLHVPCHHVSHKRQMQAPSAEFALFGDDDNSF